MAEQVSTSGGGGWGAPAANVNVESNTSGGWGQPAPVSSQSYAPPPAADSSGYASVAEQDRLVEEQPFSRRPRGQNDYQKKEFQFTRASDDYQQQQQYNRGSPRQQQQYDYQTTRRQPPEDYRRPREEQFGGGSYGYQQQEQSYDRQPPRGAAQEHYGQQRYGQERGAYSRQERESRDNYAQDNYDRGGYQQQQQRDNRKYGGDSYGGQYNRDEGYGGQPKYNREDDYGQQRGGYQQQRQRHDDYQQQESYGGDNRRGGYDSAYESRGPQGGMSGYGGPAAGGMSGYGESYDSNAPAREPPRESIRPDEDLPSVNRSAAKRSGKYTEERDAELEGDLFGRQMLTGIRFAEYGKIPVKVQGERVPRPINEASDCTILV